MNKVAFLSKFKSLNKTASSTSDLAWFFKNLSYLGFALLGIIILIILGVTNTAPWGTLYAWLVGLPFGIVAVFSSTVIPKFLMSLSLKLSKKTNSHKRGAMFFSTIGGFLFIGRYFLYIIPIIIVAAVNNFQVDGIFHIAGVVAVVALVPTNSIFLNYVFFRSDLKKMMKKGVPNVASGDSLSAN
ncbi:MG406 family protein [[Mycoplasma] testudinis]|uniref:MG406 family protein n=1 Tax=[Mycoplasma] testudinis TaxID=33924 RepID=UPI00047F27F5|nr:MG406 family protein [[Mycoplasma] testudinis]